MVEGLGWRFAQLGAEGLLTQRIDCEGTSIEGVIYMMYNITKKIIVCIYIR